jgi:glycosyltransferase involved in cell wall biosynthesis
VTSVHRRLTILMSAYACRPHRGSEPGVGWNMATRLAAHHDVHVITTPEQRSDIETELRLRPVPGMHVHYHSLGIEKRIRKVGTLVQFHYYAWQATLYFTGRRLRKSIRFDLAHHVTLVRYWAPNTLALLPIPFIFGPVGGAEQTPAAFLPVLGLNARLFERVRDCARKIAEWDPLVRMTIRRAVLTVVTTPESGRAVRRLGARRVLQNFESGLADEDLAMLGAFEPLDDAPFKVISMSRLVAWKALDLGLRAFAEAAVTGSEYWILGAGPRAQALRGLAEELGVGPQVRFYGSVARVEALRLLGSCHVLLHPSLHDSGGWVCAEAMAAGRPVLCFALGGPGQQVPPEAGFCVAADQPHTAIAAMAAHLRTLAVDRARARQMGAVGRRHVTEQFSWSRRVDDYSRIYSNLLAAGAEV